MKLKILILSAFCSLTLADIQLPPLVQIYPDDNIPPAALTVQPLSDDNIALFGTTLQAIRQLYVTPVSDDTITTNAVRGMLENLDPHSDYLDRTDYQALKTMTDGEFSGLGAEITSANGAILVISPLDGSPAAKAGVKAGDYIIKINDVAVEGLSLIKAMDMMRGPKGEKVTLTIIRKGVTSPLVIPVIRDNITLQDVKAKVLAGHYGYIRISEFEGVTGAHVKAAVKQLYQQTHNQLYGVILDLRNNPGGVVDAATDTANVFLNAARIGANKRVVYTKGRVSESQYTGYVTGTDDLHGLPIVILINAGTASAAEIVTGALQDYHRALVVGIRSFGKGSVQTVFPLPGDQTAIKLTTALYYTPSGRVIQAQGITPDVIVHNYDIPVSVKPNDTDAIRESELNNHIDGAAAPIASSRISDDKNQSLQQIVNDDSQSKRLIYKDYQLYQALGMLMGLHADTENFNPIDSSRSAS